MGYLISAYYTKFCSEDLEGRDNLEERVEMERQANIKIDTKETGYESVFWIQVARTFSFERGNEYYDLVKGEGFPEELSD
jgi:hypothetical protein